jgi:ankyrin repeat protein
MSSANLPDRASLDYLKKLAKERLRDLRATDPSAQLSKAQLDVARHYGFSSWRALKAEVDRRRMPATAAFFTACRSGDATSLNAMLLAEPLLVRERNAEGSTGLHAAIAQPDCVRLLLQHGADPNARDRGDNASALHFAAALGYVETVRALLDAGADVHGFGDVHQGEVIGWAVGDGTHTSREVVDLLLARGARHHIFSAIALDDMDLVHALVDEDPDVLSRRRSHFEERQTPLHFALASPTGLTSKVPQYEMADLLIDLGADLEAEDDKGRTPLAVAMLRGDAEAMRRLKAAGAKEPPSIDSAPIAARVDTLRASMQKQLTPMLCVDDVEAAVAWYAAIGFTIDVRFPTQGPIEFAAMSFGKVEFMVQSRGTRPNGEVALWFTTNRIDELYQLLKSRQLEAAKASMAGEKPSSQGIRFLEDLYEPFYGGRQFSVADANGVELVFRSE